MAMKVNYKQLTKAGLVAVLYGLLSAIAVNDFLNVVNSYSTGLLGLSQLIHAVLPNFSMSLLMTILNVPLFILLGGYLVFGTFFFQDLLFYQTSSS